MGIYDRDWYRKTSREKEQKYGSDFSAQRGGSGVRTNQARPKQPEPGAPRPEPQVFHTAPTQAQVFSENSYRSFRLGDVDGDPASMSVLGVCPKCQNLFPIQLLKQQMYRYHYACPLCNQQVTVIGRKQKTGGGKLLTGIAWIILVPVGVFLVSVLGHYLYTNVFPVIRIWFLETFGAYL